VQQKLENAALFKCIRFPNLLILEVISFLSVCVETYVVWAGLKPMQPTQLHWAPHLWDLRHGVWVAYSFLPDTPCAWEFSRNAI